MSLLGLVLYAAIMGFGFLSPQTESQKPTIVSPKHPTDSLGETVYEQQGKEDKDQPIVPGVLVPPRPIKEGKPKYSKALKKEKYAGTITLYGAVTGTGEAIDLEATPGDDGEAIACAMQAVRQYRFAAATLDGKPVATRLRVIVEFRMF